MTQDTTYQFSPEKRSALEALPHALAAYQYVGGSVKTLLVSDGMCRFTGRKRAELTQRLNNDMFASVHPDDVEMLANLGYAFLTNECVYDVVYRTRLVGKEDYRLVHVVGKYQSMEDGARVAMLLYSDITDTPHHQMQALSTTESPKSHFLDENLGAMVVVSQSDHRLLYYNKAMARLLPPQATYDSGITFHRYFFQDENASMRDLFLAVDAGPRIVVDPLTQRKIEADVVSTRFGGEPAFVIYFYELQPSPDVKSQESALRHRRAAFNAAIFSSESNGLSFRDGAYKGFRV